MNKDIKDRWIAELRSGNYQQTVGKLQTTSTTDENLPVGYCCLGVLCELAIEDGVELDRTTGADQYENGSLIRKFTRYDDSAEDLPNAVLDWAGIEAASASPAVSVLVDDVSTPYTRDMQLAEANDGGYSFDEIADILEQDETL